MNISHKVPTYTLEDRAADVRDRRIDLGLSQVELASMALGVTESDVVRVESAQEVPKKVEASIFGTITEEEWEQADIRRDDRRRAEKIDGILKELFDIADEAGRPADQELLALARENGWKV